MTALRMLALLGFFLGSLASAETLESVIIAAGISAAPLPPAKLHQKITNYAVSKGDPFLLAYYNDDGSGFLHAPLNMIRYSATNRVFHSRSLTNISSSLSVNLTAPRNCFGSVLSIRELHASIYIDTHINPSAGCVLILSSDFKLKAALSGWLVGVLGENYAILHENEIHFAFVHPMELAVFDVAHSELASIYPPQNDPLRTQFASSIQAHMPPPDWCTKTNSQCDSANFDSELDGNLSINEPEKLFGFVAGFDVGGFGDLAHQYVPPATVAYFFRLDNGVWEYREFKTEELKQIFGLGEIPEIVSQKAKAIFTVTR